MFSQLSLVDLYILFVQFLKIDQLLFLMVIVYFFTYQKKKTKNKIMLDLSTFIVLILCFFVTYNSYANQLLYVNKSMHFLHFQFLKDTLLALINLLHFVLNYHCLVVLQLFPILYFLIYFQVLYKSEYKNEYLTFN